MNRRKFLSNAAATVTAAAISHRIRAQQMSAFSSAVPREATLHLDNAATLPSMPLEFTGLSYESAQLTNPDFFSAHNTQLVAAFRTLTTNGVLRLGGHLSNLTVWRDQHPETLTAAQQQKIDSSGTAYEWLTVDSVGGKDRAGVITPLAIRNLRDFLDATGWKLLYGLNPVTGTPARAAIEGAYVYDTIGPHLIAFQVGNEADRFRSVGTKDYIPFDRYWADTYLPFVKAVRSKTPHARFAGPDTTRRATEWEIDYAKHAKGDTVLITSHYYAVGSKIDLATDTQRLLHPDPKLTTVDIPKALEAAKIAGVPYRMSEGNSCPHGGEDGLSNAYASALWSADYMLLVAQAGFSGVNLHGGGEGRYSPIVGEVASGFSERPVYYGMLLASKFAGSKFVGNRLDTGGSNSTAYVALKPDGGTLLAVLNKDPQPIRLNVESLSGSPRRAWALSGPSLNSKTGVAFAATATPKTKHLDIPSCSGLLVDFA